MPPVSRFHSSAAEVLDWVSPVEQVVTIPKPLLRAYEATVEDVSKAERMIVAKINTGDVDRYKTVISPEGIDLVAYRKNPCVLWEHGKDPQRGSLPIGRNQWIKPGGSGTGMLIAKTLFGKDEYSRALFDMYEDGTLRGWSVNILPDNKRCSPPTKEEMRARPELSECTMMYRLWRACRIQWRGCPGQRRDPINPSRKRYMVPGEINRITGDGSLVERSWHLARRTQKVCQREKRRNNRKNRTPRRAILP